VEEALAHPTWKMGAKITVDSATLFNKGLEIIEAVHLFGIPPERIEVVRHRQSVVHSLVEFSDGNLKAQLSVPDMRLPILFALSYPERVESELVQTDVSRLGSLTFEPVPLAEYPCLALCREALRRGGTAPAALSAADEVAVDAFLQGRIGFNDIARTLSAVLENWPDEPLTSVADVRKADGTARAMAMKFTVQGEVKTKQNSCC
jgi:1-deoxy-D-xylulose-5-phosphate reductoisomerase